MNFVDPTEMDVDCFPIVDKRGEVVGQDCYEKIDVVDGRGGPGGGGGGGGGGSRGGEKGRKEKRVNCGRLPRNPAPAGQDLRTNLSGTRSMTSGGPFDFAIGTSAVALQTGLVGGVISFKTHLEDEQLDPNYDAFQTFGNFHFGAAVRAIGIPLLATQAFAGAVERFVDDGEVGSVATFYEDAHDLSVISLGWHLAPCYY